MSEAERAKAYHYIGKYFCSIPWRHQEEICRNLFKCGIMEQLIISEDQNTVTYEGHTATFKARKIKKKSLQ